MWISRKEYQLMVELKQAVEHKALYFEQANLQLARENRRLIERLLAKADVPLVEAPDNIIANVLKGAQQDYTEEGGDLFEDELGEPVIPKDSKEEAKREQESDRMEMQP